MTSAFRAAVDLYRHASDATFDGDTITGSIQINDIVIDWLRIINQANPIVDLAIAERSKSIDTIEENIGAVAKFEVAVPSGSANHGYFVEQLDDLLRRPEHCLKVPELYYIRNIDLLVPDEEHDLAVRYRQAARLVSMLKAMADFVSVGQISFVAPGRLDLDIIYAQKDLERARLDQLDKLHAELNTETPDQHSERRQEIFVSTLADYLKNMPKEQRLGQVIRHLDELYRRYRRDYDLYAKDFSFSKMVSEIDEKKAEQMKRLNGVIQDISTKLLSIPLAYVLIAGQLTQGGAMKNHIIIIGASVFSLLMIMIVVGQLLTLRHIRQDIGILKSTYKDRLDEAGLNVQFKQLTTKHLMQAATLWTVAAIVVAVFGMAFYLYRDYTTPDLVDMAISAAASLISYLN